MSNWGFVCTFSAMLCTVGVLHGCTQLDKTESQARRWDVEVISLPDGTCNVSIIANHKDTQDDDTVTLHNPTKGK